MNETVNPPVITDSPPPVGKKKFSMAFGNPNFLRSMFSNLLFIGFWFGAIIIKFRNTGRIFVFFLFSDQDCCSSAHRHSYSYD